MMLELQPEMQLDGPGTGLFHQLALADLAERAACHVRIRRGLVQQVEQVGEQ